LTYPLQRRVCGTVDDHDGFVRILLDDAREHLVEELDRLVDHRDDHTGGGTVRSGPRPVATRQHDLDDPNQPDDRGEHGEQIDAPAVF
jgi:hypothetical protein